jgi:hypothetical protein
MTDNGWLVSWVVIAFTFVLTEARDFFDGQV